MTTRRCPTWLGSWGLAALWALLPRPSAAVPADGWIVWASDRNGVPHDIYLMQADGSGVTRLTTSGAKNPHWSPDGRWIAYETVPLGATRVMRWDKSEDHQVSTGRPSFWKQDGSGLICKVGDDLYQVNPDTGASALFVHKSDFGQLSGKTWSPSGLTRDNRWLLTWSDRYRNGYTGDNGTFNAYNSAIILDMQDRSKLYYFGNGCEPTAPPSGGWIYHVCGLGPCDATHPDVYKMQIADIGSRSSYQPEMAHADLDWGHEYFPRISTDGLWLTYGATDDGCHDHDTCDYEIFVHQLGQGNADRVRVTTHTDNDQWPHMYVGTLWSAPSPRLALAPTSLSFNAIEGGANPGSRTIAVSNSASGTLDSVVATEDAAWLTVSRSGSGNAQTLSNAIDSSGLTAGSYNTTVQVACGNASNSPLSYSVSLVVAVQSVVTSVAVSIAVTPILARQSVQLTAVARDQNSAAIAATIGWSVAAGGSVSPSSSGGAVTEHTTTFTSDGSLGQFAVTAVASGVEGSATVEVVATPLPLAISCGSNDYDVAGWWRDDLFVTGGADWINPNDVDTSGVANAAPAQVYKSVRHQGPHAYSIPLPDGDYLLRLHFADAYTDRSMDYFVEGVQILDNFDIATEAGGVNRALVKDFDVTVADGDGMQLEARSDSDDVFEAAIEVLPAVIADAGAGVDRAGPRPDAATAVDGAGPQPDSGTSVPDRAGTDLSGIDLAGSLADATSPDASSSPPPRVEIADGCSCAAHRRDAAIPVPALLYAVLGLVLARRRMGLG